MTFSRLAATFEYYGLLVDSTPDLAHREQLSQVIRFFDINFVSKKFSGFYRIALALYDVSYQPLIFTVCKNTDKFILNFWGISMRQIQDYLLHILDGLK